MLSISERRDTGTCRDGTQGQARVAVPWGSEISTAKLVVMPGVDFGEMGVGTLQVFVPTPLCIPLQNKNANTCASACCRLLSLLPTDSSPRDFYTLPKLFLPHPLATDFLSKAIIWFSNLIPVCVFVVRVNTDFIIL